MCARYVSFILNIKRWVLLFAYAKRIQSIIYSMLIDRRELINIRLNITRSLSTYIVVNCSDASTVRLGKKPSIDSTCYIY